MKGIYDSFEEIIEEEAEIRKIEMSLNEENKGKTYNSIEELLAEEQKIKDKALEILEEKYLMEEKNKNINDEERRKLDSQGFNLPKIKQFNQFEGFIQYTQGSDDYQTFTYYNQKTKRFENTEGYKVQKSFPFTVVNIKGNKIKYCTIGYGSNYPSVSVNGKSLKIHQLVGQNFINNDSPLTKTIIDHEFGNHFDWRIQNLRWYTPKQNADNKHFRTDLRIFDELPETSILINTYTSSKGEHHVHQLKTNTLYYNYNLNILIRFKSGKYCEVNTRDGNSIVVDDINDRRVWIALSNCRDYYISQRM